jgi:hypothetical protein
MEEKEEVKKKTNVKLIVLIAAIAVLLSGAVGFVTWKIMNGGNNKNAANTEKKEEKEEEKKEEETKEEEAKEEETKEDAKQLSGDIYLVDKIEGFDHTKKVDYKVIDEYSNKGILVECVYTDKSDRNNAVGVYVLNEKTGMHYFKNYKTNKIYASKKWKFTDSLVHLAQGDGVYLAGGRYLLLTTNTEENIFDVEKEEIVLKESVKNTTINDLGYRQNIYIDENGNFLINRNGKYTIVDRNEKVLVQGYDYIDPSDYTEFYFVIKNNKLGVLKDYKEFVKPSIDFNIKDEFGIDGFRPHYNMCCGASSPYAILKVKNGNYLIYHTYGLYLFNASGKIIKENKFEVHNDDKDFESDLRIRYDSENNVLNVEEWFSLTDEATKHGVDKEKNSIITKYSTLTGDKIN